MATLTVRNLDDSLIRALRIRAAEHGRSAEAEHRELLRQVLEDRSGAAPDAVAERLAAFRQRTSDRESAPSAELLRENRQGRSDDLAGRVGA